MTLTKIKTSQASSPLIIKIQTFSSSFDEKYMILVKIPHQKDIYKEISKIGEMMIVSHQMEFKIQTKQSLKQSKIMGKSKVSDSGIKKVEVNPTVLLGTIQIESNQFTCQAQNQIGKISVKGKILNENQGKQMVFDLSIHQIINYQAFYTFRKKYKTMENITRKINFNLDHRLKMTQKDKKPLYFSLEQEDTQHHFFSCSAELTFSIEEIYSVQDFYDIKQIYQETVSLQKQFIEKRSEKQFCHKLQLGFEKLKLVIKADIVRNQNLTGSQLVSLRVFQTSGQQIRVYVGTDKMKRTLCLPSLIDNRFYDYQYGYLCKNLKQFAQENNQGNQGHDNLQKITKCFPDYPNFINQAILDVKNCQSIQIQTESGEEFSIPFVYTLKGYNVFHGKKGWIKFYIEFQSKDQQAKEKRQGQNQTKYSSEHRRIFQMKIHNFWNLSSVEQQKFDVRIICNNLIYSIPFESSLIDANAFKKQSRNLQNRVQYNERMGERFYLLKRKTGQANKYLQMVKTQSIKDFYMLDFSSSGSVSFEISSGNRMLMTGFLSKSQIIKSRQKGTKLVISSPNQQKKVVLLLSFQEISYQNKSLRSIYNFRYQLYYADDAMVPAEATYDLQVRRVSDDKKFRKRVVPEQKTQDYKVMKDFYEEGLFTKYLQQEVTVTLRKMHYNQETNIFDNEQLVRKRVVINPEPERILELQSKESESKPTFLKIDQECFNSVEIDFYDSNIKQRLRLIVEVSLRKFQFLDQEKARYVIRIPQYLWRLNTAIKEKEKFQFQTLLSHKKKRGEKLQIEYGDQAQFRMSRYNYKDAFSVKVVNQNQRMGFSRVVDAVKIKCDVLKESIGWIKQSEWYFAVMNVESDMFYFLIKTQFDPHADQVKGDSGSQKTVSHQSRKKGQKVNPLAKTMKNMDILKLKMMKNDATMESRHLTLKVVQKEEKIAQLNKKIAELQENLRNKRQKEHLIREQPRKVNTKQYTRLKKLYRQICECGAKNPQFNGFCASCLQKMKSRYESILKQHKEVQIKFQKVSFQKRNKRMKLLKAKEKLRNYYDRLNAGQDLNEQSTMEMLKNLQQKQLKRRIQQLKIDLFTIEEEKNTTAEMSKLQSQKLQEKVARENEQIVTALEQLKQLKVRMQHIKQRARLDTHFK